MLLTIRTLSCPPPDNPQNIFAQFGASGGRIGRNPPCTLILPDPNRHISREHAEIRLRDGAFSLKVVSKVNSVMVNDAVIGPGEAVQINDGDQILIGEYLMRAEVAGVAVAAPPAPALFAPAAPAPATADPFAAFDSLAAARVERAPAAPVVPDWFQSPAAVPSPPPPVAGAGLDDFFKPTGDGARFADVLQSHPPTSRPDSYLPPPAAPAPVDRRLDEFLGLNDPIAIEPETRQIPGNPDLYRASPLDVPLNATSVPLAPPARPAEPPAFSSHDDIFKALEQDFGAFAAPPPPALAPPAVAPAAFAVPVAAPVVPVAVPPAPTFAVPPVSLAPPAPLANPYAPADSRLPQAPAVPPVPAVEPMATPFPGLSLPEDPPTMRLPRGAQAGDSEVPAAPPFADVRAPAAPGVDPQHLMAVLADALGLEPGDLDASRPEDTLRLVGELLRMSTDGLFRMLEMRSQLKSELHIEDRTMIASRENNPLKHADTARDAIAYLVDLRQHGNKLFMPPNKAVEDTIWDICAHEMAVMAGTRAALLAALKMFSPEVIEGRIKKTGALENVLPALHKSRLWERFLGMYAELQHEAEDHFDRLLNQEFSKAYSEQSKKLKKKRQ
jgi:type VI secretion system FHA domain protein